MKISKKAIPANVTLLTIFTKILLTKSCDSDEVLLCKKDINYVLNKFLVIRYLTRIQTSFYFDTGVGEPRHIFILI